MMTSFAFVLGVLPLARAVGAGFETRQALGTAVASVMLGVTIFGPFLTPAFYILLRRSSDRLRRRFARDKNVESTISKDGDDRAELGGLRTNHSG